MGNYIDAFEAYSGFSTDKVWDKDYIYLEGKFLTVRALQTSLEKTNDPKTANFFPEKRCLGFVTKPDVAVGFSGGGIRGYLCVIGFLAGLRDLNLLEKIKYLGGVSGSSWAVVAFTYSQLEVDDSILLGELNCPQELTIKKLNEMHPKCMRASASRPVTELLDEHYLPEADNDFSAAWRNTVSDTFLRPVGIKPHRYFSYTNDHIKEIKARNPSLAKSKFYLPSNISRPFPIIGASLVGPNQVMPPDDSFLTVNREPFYFIEITPLYIGNFFSKQITYNFGHGEDMILVGGVVEPIAYDKKFSPASKPLKGLRKGQQEGILTIPKPSESLDLKDCIAMSSYATETVINPNFVMKDEGALSCNFWSCLSTHPISSDMLVADGRYTQAIPLISFLQRRVENIILFIESEIPLKSSKEWNVDEDPTADNKIDKSFASYFGIFPKEGKGKVNLEKNQVFLPNDFINVVKGLQEAQEKGEPMMYCTELLTVENTWWGIPAGVLSNVLFSYLGDIKIWEDQLPNETQNQLRGKDEFSEFPFYPENLSGISTKNSNLLCNMVGWSVTRNKKLFEKIFSESERRLPCLRGYKKPAARIPAK